MASIPQKLGNIIILIFGMDSHYSFIFARFFVPNECIICIYRFNYHIFASATHMLPVKGELGIKLGFQNKGHV